MTKAQLVDLGSRAAWTAAQGFLAVFTVTDLSTARAGVVAGIAAGLSVIKTFVAAKASRS